MKFAGLEAKLDAQQNTIDSLRQSLHSVTERLDKQLELVSKACAFQIGKLTAQLKVNIESLDALDTNFLASVKVVKELVGQLVLLQAQLKILDPNTPLALPSDKPLEERVNSEKVIEEAKAWYIELINDALQTVQIEKEEHERRQRERAEADAQAQQALQEVVDASSKKTNGSIEQPTTAGPGSEHPEGAQIFGG